VLVQVARVPNASERAALAGRGLDLQHWIPERGFLAWIERDAVDDPEVARWVEWSAEIPLPDKMQEMLRVGTCPEYAVTPDGRLRLVVKTFPDVASSDGRRVLEEQGAEIAGALPLFHRFEILIPAQDVATIAGLDLVRWVRPASPPPELDNDGARADQKADEVQGAPYNLSGVNVDVGEIDGGNPETTHGDLAGRVTLVEAVGTGGHATHVAGTIIGDGSRSEAQGGTPLQWKGMAPSAEVFSWNFGGSYLSFYSSAIATHAIELATNSWGWGVDNSNCAIYGDYGDDAPEHDDIITGLHGKRIAIFFSAGNERDDCDCGMSCAAPFVNYANIRPPGATSKNTMTIGAKNADQEQPADFSSWGPMDDGRLKPEVVATGDEIGGDGGVKSCDPGNDYSVRAGTSMSTPTAAGCAALFVEDFRALTASDPLPSSVKAFFCHTAKDLTAAGISYLNPGPDYATGYGKLNVKRAIDRLRTGDWAEDEVDQGGIDRYVLAVPDDATIVRVTLAWDDEPGAENANPALVNDLDLVVANPLGGRHYPWTLEASDPTEPAKRTKEDHINVVEQVVADDAIALFTGVRAQRSDSD
jgi:subtilisin family serine protease